MCLEGLRAGIHTARALEEGLRRVYPSGSAGKDSHGTGQGVLTWSESPEILSKMSQGAFFFLGNCPRAVLRVTKGSLKGWKSPDWVLVHATYHYLSGTQKISLRSWTFSPSLYGRQAEELNKMDKTALQDANRSEVPFLPLETCFLRCPSRQMLSSPLIKGLGPCMPSTLHSLKKTSLWWPTVQSSRIWIMKVGFPASALMITFLDVKRLWVLESASS